MNNNNNNNGVIYWFISSALLALSHKFAPHWKLRGDL
jgi:hypothetical protein